MRTEVQKKIELAHSGKSINLRYLLAVVAAAFIAIGGGWYFFTKSSDDLLGQDSIRTADHDGCFTPRQNLSFGDCLQIEIVSSQSELIQGLSGREKLEGGTGMLFDFGTLGQRCMWMKDMQFGLDMVWLDNQKRITTIKESVLPESFPESFCGGDQDRYVLEVNKGVVAERGLRVGERVDW